MEYSRQDVETMMKDKELMQLVKVDAEIDSVVDDLATKMNTDSISVSLALDSNIELINEAYHAECVELEKLTKRLDWLKVRYCAYNQVKKDELEDVLYYLKD